MSLCFGISLQKWVTVIVTEGSTRTVPVIYRWTVVHSVGAIELRWTRDDAGHLYGLYVKSVPPLASHQKTP